MSYASMEKTKTERLVAWEQNQKKSNNPSLPSPTANIFDRVVACSLPSFSKGGDVSSSLALHSHRHEWGGSLWAGMLCSEPEWPPGTLNHRQGRSTLWPCREKWWQTLYSSRRLSFHCSLEKSGLLKQKTGIFRVWVTLFFSISAAQSLLLRAPVSTGQSVLRERSLMFPWVWKDKSYLPRWWLIVACLEERSYGLLASQTALSALPLLQGCGEEWRGGCCGICQCDADIQWSGWV